MYCKTEPYSAASITHSRDCVDEWHGVVGFMEYDHRLLTAGFGTRVSTGAAGRDTFCTAS